jgi:O-antigen ligase
MATDFLTKWINFLVFLFSVTVLSYSGHGGQSAIVLLLTMFYVFIAKRKESMNLTLHKEEKIFVYLILVFWLLQLFGILYQPEGYEFANARAQLKSFDYPMRWLLLLPIFFLLRRYIVDWRVVAIGMSIGVFVTVAIATHQVYVLGLNRAYGASNHPIPFAELMVVADLLLWMLMIYAWNNGNKIISFILLVASLAGFYGSLLSVTRGAWLVYIFMIAIWLLYMFKRGFSGKVRFFSAPIIARLLLAVLVFYTVSQTDQYQVLQSRSMTTVNNLAEGNYNSATGDRLAIYQDAFKVIKQYPFGIGTDNFSSIKSYGASHAHNELLNLWVENGIQGVIALLLLLGYAFKVFYKNLNHANDLVSVYSACGLMLIVSYMIFGFSQAVFSHHQTIIFFIFYLYFFLAQISVIKKQYVLEPC